MIWSPFFKLVECHLMHHRFIGRLVDPSVDWTRPFIRLSLFIGGGLITVDW